YRYTHPGTHFDYAGHLGVGAILLTAYAFSSRFFKRENLSLRISTKSLFWQSAMEITFALTVTFAVIFLLKLEFVSRIVVGCFSIAFFSLLVAIRYFLSWWYFQSGRATSDTSVNVLIIGSGRRARYLACRLSKWSGWGVNVVGFLDPLGVSAGHRKNDAILGHVDQISEILRQNVVEEVIVAVPRSLLGDLQQIISACQEEGVRLCFMADVYDFKAASIEMALVDGIPLITFEPVMRAESKQIVKRMLDLFLVLLAMPVLLPVFVAVAVIVKLDSPGPVFFTQSRVGFFKRSFKMYKFRSMAQGAEQQIVEVEHLNEAVGPNFKIHNDPRITRAGKWLRRTSIDELPQLINVLRGEMSLVGPRPMSYRDVLLFDKGIQRKRFSVRPGVTGLWQVSGRSSLSFDKWLSLDLEYIDRWSL
ncbi:MAG: sugar transferase, partial [Woeseiaceae bacterium]